MKKTLLLLTGLLLYSYTITNTKVYTKEIKPAFLKANLQITLTQKNLGTLMSLLNTNVNTLKNFCQNTSYTFVPVYTQINKKEVFEYYRAYINSSCLFKSSKIKDFSSVINRLKNAKVKLTSLNFTIDKKERKEALDTLKTKAYRDILKEATDISKKLSKHCFATNISVYTPYKQQSRSFMTKSFAASLPEPRQTKTVSVKADYKIECY